jgi:hypothetical protein
VTDHSPIEKLKSDRASVEARLTELVDQMELVSQQIVAAIANEVREDWATIVNDAISAHPEAVAQLSDDDLRQVKVSLAELQAQADELVPPRFDQPDIWNHRRREVERRGRISAYRPTAYDGQPEFPDLLEEPVRRALGEIGQILRQIIPRDHHEWQAWQRSDWARFGRKIAPGDVTRHLLNDYAQLDLQLIRERDRVDELTREIVRLEAKSRWDSI